MKRFEGRTAMVTGAGKNIGKEIALAFAQEGANLIVCDYNRENAEETAHEIEAFGVSAMPAVCDVRDRDNIFAFAEEAVRRFGRIDILVNNAGGSAGLLNKLTRFVDAQQETLDFVIDTNLKGAMHCTQAVLRSMIRERYGRIINISSIAALCGLYDRVDYAAAKAGLIGMTRALAMEVGEFDICVNCVSPGAIERDGQKQEHMTFLGENGRSGTPKDVAQTVLFLASQDFITGQNFVVDGGRTLGPGHR
ncbi:MAG TPA: SDR family oxidoreductase [Candidatus Eisenbergiella stercoravium]|nr:SDR family oxidoreductase [Candidatus Eisenbergiella stercoravium]